MMKLGTISYLNTRGSSRSNLNGAVMSPYLLPVIISHFLLGSVHAGSLDALIYATNYEGTETISSTQAEFGPTFNVYGYTGLLMVADPLDACTKIHSPNDQLTDYPFFALVEQGDCDFEDKVFNAQNAGFEAVVVYNKDNDSRINMKSNGRHEIKIPSTFVGRSDGLDLKDNYTLELNAFRNINAKVTIKGDFLIPLKMYLIPFVVIVGVCFSIMLLFVLFKLVRDHRAKLKNRLSRRGLKKLPTRKWKKGDVECMQWDSCAICLDEYEDGHKLRLLPCKHAFHTKCIDPWLTETRRVCPLCKQRITPRGEIEEPTPPSTPDEEQPETGDSVSDQTDGSHDELLRNEHDAEMSNSNSRVLGHASGSSGARRRTDVDDDLIRPDDREPDAHTDTEDEQGVEYEPDEYEAGRDDCPLIDLRMRSQNRMGFNSARVASSDPESNDSASERGSRISRLFKAFGKRSSRRSNSAIESTSATEQGSSDVTVARRSTDVAAQPVDNENRLMRVLNHQRAEDADDVMLILNRTDLSGVRVADGNEEEPVGGVRSGTVNSDTCSTTSSASLSFQSPYNDETAANKDAVISKSDRKSRLAKSTKPKERKAEMSTNNSDGVSTSSADYQSSRAASREGSVSSQGSSRFFPTLAVRHPGGTVDTSAQRSEELPTLQGPQRRDLEAAEDCDPRVHVPDDVGLLTNV